MIKDLNFLSLLCAQVSLGCIKLKLLALLGEESYLGFGLLLQVRFNSIPSLVD